MVLKVESKQGEAESWHEKKEALLTEVQTLKSKELLLTDKLLNLEKERGDLSGQVIKTSFHCIYLIIIQTQCYLIRLDHTASYIFDRWPSEA